MNILYDALRNADIPMPRGNIDTYRIVRWGRNNRYWLRKFEGGYVFGDFAGGISEYVFEKVYRGKALAEAQIRMQKARKETETEQEKAYERGSIRASEIWNSAIPLASHDYFTRKKIFYFSGLKEYKGCILIPLRDEFGKLWSLQFISSDGTKKFMCGGKKKGCHFTIGNVEKSEEIFICEGYATGATIHECTEIPVVVAFDAGGLKPIAKIIRAKYPNAKIVICADNDQYHENGTNPGVEKATDAAREIDGYVVKPEFNDTSTKPTDFNDLFILEGSEAVKNAIEQVEEKESAGFHLSDDGLFYIFEKDSRKVRISNYIAVQAFVKEKDGTTSRLVEFKDYQNRSVKTLLRAKLFAVGGDQAKVHLISKGFISSWSSFEKCKLMEYLLQSIPEKEVGVVGRTGYIDKAYVRSDVVIGDLSEELILDVSVGDAAFGSNETLENWIQNVSSYCRHNSRLTFCVSMAFASMLLKPCGTPSGGFHLAGNSSSGKTTCLRVAASVFGAPNYLKTWRTTDNALEGAAFKRNDALLILDEISEMSSKAGDVAYMFADGEGKDRMDRNCDLKETFRWRMLFLSSGEADLAAHLAESAKKSKAGQEVRFVSIPANSISEQNGIFEDLHGFADVSDFGKLLQESAANCYGTASIEFVKRVLSDSNIRENFREDFRRMKAVYLPEKASSQDKRVFERCMFVGFAGELATKYGITSWRSGESCDAALKCFNSWLGEKGGVGDLEEKRLTDQAIAFFEAHVSSRFMDIDGFKDQRINNLAGYKREVENELVYYVTTSVFRDEICRGFNRNYAVEVFKKKGMLLGYQQKWTPHGNKRVYVFSGKAFGEYE